MSELAFISGTSRSDAGRSPNVFGTLYRTNIRKKFKKWLWSTHAIDQPYDNGQMNRSWCVECERRFNENPLLDFSLKQEVILRPSASGVPTESQISFGVWHIILHYILNGGLPTLYQPLCGAKNYGGTGWWFTAYEIFNTPEFCRNVGREAGGRVFLHELSNERIEAIIALTEFQRLGKETN